MRSCLRKAEYLLFVLVLVMTVFSGCLLENDQPKTRPDKSRGLLINDDPISQGTARLPLTVVSREFTRSGSTVSCPYVASEDMDLLNLSIQSAFFDFADRLNVEGGRVGYSVEFNRSGLLSFIITLTSPRGGLLYVDTVNFDCDTGHRVFLDECFGRQTAEYAPRLTEIVTRYAAENGLTVLGEVPDVKNNSAFIFTSYGVCLIYREYELCTYDGGTPRIPVTFIAVKDLITSKGLLNRLN